MSNVLFASHARFFMPVGNLAPYPKREQINVWYDLFCDSALLRRTKITAPPSWTKAWKTIVLSLKFFFVPLAQLFWIIWIRLLDCTWKVTSINEGSRAAMVEAITLLLSKLCGIQNSFSNWKKYNITNAADYLQYKTICYSLLPDEHNMIWPVV